jgi:hypothetical protein
MSHRILPPAVRIINKYNSWVVQYKLSSVDRNVYTILYILFWKLQSF